MKSGRKQNAIILTAGAPLEEAEACAVMIHGRGAGAESILALAEILNVGNVCYLAPQAPDYSWYPYSFLDELEKNRNGIENGLRTIELVLEQIEKKGPGSGKTALIGFSQGACLAVQFAATHPARYGALSGLAGGLIGPPGTRFSFSGTLSGTPVFLGCGDPDPHIPRWRVEETATVMNDLHAAVDLRFYPGIGHAVNDDEITKVRRLLSDLVDSRTVKIVEGGTS